MHMADSLISPEVGGIMCGVSLISCIFAGANLQKEENFEQKIPLTAVAGAFVFAAQMVNFAIPGTGSSGHIGGGILLAALLGKFPALLAMSVVLVIQCLFFADGGLLALGCNIFNMGVIPCLLIYPLFQKLFLSKTNSRKIAVVSLFAAIIALQFGAFAVTLETKISGITALPFTNFLILMQPIHLAIGLVEGIITAFTLSFIYKMRPELFTNAAVSTKKVVVTLAVITVFVAGILALIASSHPDGLEWSIQKITGDTEIATAESAVFEKSAEIQENTALMPDYTISGKTPETSLAGIFGCVLTFLLAGITAFTITFVKKRKNVNTK